MKNSVFPRNTGISYFSTFPHRDRRFFQAFFYCFDMKDDGGVYLNREGKAVFLREFENKMHCVITENEQRLTYEKLIRTEIKKLAVCILEEQEYIPYKYQ